MNNAIRWGFYLLLGLAISVSAQAEVEVETLPDFAGYDEIIIDRPPEDVWPILVDMESWIVTHKIEYIAGKPGQEGALTRYTPKAYLGIPESERPIRSHHFGKILRYIKNENILHSGFSYNEGSYGGKAVFKFYLDYRLRKLDGDRTLVVFNGLGFYGNQTSQEEADLSGENSARTMRQNLQNLKALVEQAD